MNSMYMDFKGTLPTRVEERALAVSLVIGLQPGTVDVVLRFLTVLLNDDPLALVPVLAVLTAEEFEDISNMLMEILAHTQNNG
ncbi:hypothetical protein [Geomonas propionica]|uniref:Uncharacterized protein n=1 Tax=Geomonas propionica TaxID=2798582 RepID=A0ABS0YPM6_9BACT|nr:hypothetical protein [Geomonas propionica]MBJ6799873.1 hypothetical protein [Geomonas propionica]